MNLFAENGNGAANPIMAAQVAREVGGLVRGPAGVHGGP